MKPKVLPPRLVFVQGKKQLPSGDEALPAPGAVQVAPKDHVTMRVLSKPFFDISYVY